MLKLHDGYEKLLSSVKLVPNIKKNLITVGTLDSLIYAIMVKNGKMKVSKGSLMILKAVKQKWVVHS